MTDVTDSEDDPGDPTPADMRKWLEQEVRNCHKALELRLREATQFVKAYEDGRSSWEETIACQMKYEDRWGESLPGTRAREGVTDKQLIEEIDETRLRRLARLRFTGGSDILR